MAAAMAALAALLGKRKRSAAAEEEAQLRAALMACSRADAADKCLELRAANRALTQRVVELERASTTAHGDAVAAAALVQRVAELERAVTAQGDAVAAAAREAPRDELARAAKVPRGTFCPAGASVATSDSEDGSGDEETGHDALPDAPFEPAPVDEPLARRLRQRHAADSAGDKSLPPAILLTGWRSAYPALVGIMEAAAAAGWDGVQSGQFTVDDALEHFPDDGGELCTSEKKKTKVWAVLRVLQQCSRERGLNMSPAHPVVHKINLGPFAHKFFFTVPRDLIVVKEVKDMHHLITEEEREEAAAAVAAGASTGAGAGAAAQ